MICQLGSYFGWIAIPALYLKVHEELPAKLKVLIWTTSPIADLWSSSAIEPYLSYTIHYVSTSWELKCYCLQTHYMPKLKNALTQTLRNWALDATTLVTLMTDSGQYRSACKLSNWIQLSCFGHYLDLAVHKVLQMNVLYVCRRSNLNRYWYCNEYNIYK